MLLQMNLHELRQHFADVTQEEVAELLHVAQAYVSKFERRDDVLLSTLYGYIHTLGGELELRAKFRGRDEVRVTQFEHVSKIREVAAPVEKESARKAG
jgi:hypothetical protein